MFNVVISICPSLIIISIILYINCQSWHGCRTSSYVIRQSPSWLYHEPLLAITPSRKTTSSRVHNIYRLLWPVTIPSQQDINKPFRSFRRLRCELPSQPHSFIVACTNSMWWATNCWTNNIKIYLWKKGGEVISSIDIIHPVAIMFFKNVTITCEKQRAKLKNLLFKQVVSGCHLRHNDHRKWRLLRRILYEWWLFLCHICYFILDVVSEDRQLSILYFLQGLATPKHTNLQDVKIIYKFHKMKLKLCYCCKTE